MRTSLLPQAQEDHCVEVGKIGKFEKHIYFATRRLTAVIAREICGHLQETRQFLELVLSCSSVEWIHV